MCYTSTLYLPDANFGVLTSILSILVFKIFAFTAFAFLRFREDGDEVTGMKLMVTSPTRCPKPEPLIVMEVPPFVDPVIG